MEHQIDLPQAPPDNAVLPTGHFLFGGDYNPEQWLDHPEILETDLRLMNKAGRRKRG